MVFTASSLRRALICGAVASAVLATAAPILATGTASADPPRPANCTAADLAGIAAGVAASTSAYLFTHPDVNAFLTGLHDRPAADVPEATREYFDANPQAHAELTGIRQPLIDFRARCYLPAQMPAQ